MPSPSAWDTKSGLPAWLVSLLLHFLLIVALGVIAPKRPEGASQDQLRDGGIVLVSRTAGKAQYFSEDNAADAATGSLLSAASHATPSPFPSIDQPPLLVGPQLPVAEHGLPAGSGPPAGVPSASGLAQGSGSRGGPPGRGQNLGVETQVFGVKGKGTRFVYVFDRSGSMEGAPLAAAKRELIASLQSLQSVHQFQIIFYNQQPRLMSFRGQSPQLVFADDQGKRLAESFVGGILADGGTDHLQALSVALLMRPDVIFFLTDADEPQMTTADLQKVRRQNKGSVINAIEFGIGPSPGRHNFLRQLAQENGGEYGYVDVTRLQR